MVKENRVETQGELSQAWDKREYPGVKICRHCSSNFEITDRDLKFYDIISPKFNGIKYSIPTPRFCPECREQRRLAYRLESKFYKRKCDATSKSLITMYSPDKKDIVYDYDYWWGDKWDGLDYGVDFDFSKNFFEQIYELSTRVPKAHIDLSSSENSEYTNQAGFNKNCYLIFEAGYNEDCMYSKSIWHSKNTIDSCFSMNNQNCYECVDIEDSYNVEFSRRIKNCKNSMYLYYCDNLENCIGCWNLNGKKYFVLNEQVSVEEYEEILKKIKEDKQFKEEFLQELNRRKSEEIIHKNVNNLSSENVVGDDINDSKNCSGFSIKTSEDCYYCYDIYNSKDCMDFCYWGDNTSLVLDSISIGNTSSNVLFSYMCYENIDSLMYSMYCVNNCKNLFGCVGLKNKEYCIFNKQYTKEEYENLVPKIITHMKLKGEWGEFFPANISPFGYNETIAYEIDPLTKQNAIKKGFNWSDYIIPTVNVEKIIPASKLPYDIKNIPDDILNWAIECEITKKPYRIIKEELLFYRKYNLPIPERHPDRRHLDRMKLRNPRKLFNRKCSKCKIEIKTSNTPDTKEKVYCEGCYEREVY